MLKFKFNLNKKIIWIEKWSFAKQHTQYVSHSPEWVYSFSSQNDTN